MGDHSSLQFFSQHFFNGHFPPFNCDYNSMKSFYHSLNLHLSIGRNQPFLLIRSRLKISHFRQKPYVHLPLFSKQELIQIHSPLSRELAQLMTLTEKNHLTTSNKQQLQNAHGLIKKMLLTDQHEKLHSLSAACYVLLGNYEEAIRQYNKAWKQCSNNSKYCIQISICLMQGGNYFDAVKLLEREIIKHPQHADLYHQLAIANLMGGNYAIAISNLYKNYKLGGELSEDFLQQGKQLLDQDMYSEAIPFYAKWIIHNKDCQQAIDGLKNCFLRGGFEEGKQFYAALAQLQDYQIAAQHSLALLYFQTGNISQAEPHLLKVLPLKPDSFQLNLYLGTVYMQKGCRDEAISCFQKCLNLRSNDSTSLSSLAAIHLQLSQYDKAGSYYEKAIEANEKDSMAWYGFGIIAMHKNDIQTGIKYLKKAIQLDQLNYPALEKLASTQYILGNENQASILLKKAEEARRRSTQV